MPYIITMTSTTLHLDDPTAEFEPGAKPVQTRHAVPTLDEAQRNVRDLLVGKHWDDRNRDTSSRWIVRAQHLPESGGTVGPLPDGTVIEVRRVDNSALGYAFGLLTVDHPQLWKTETLVERFNAAHTS